MRIVRLLPLIIASMTLASCATAPVDNARPGERPAIESDEAGLWQMLERDEYKLQTSSGVIRDPGLQGYLEIVLCRVTPDYCGDIRVYVIPSYSLNASMAPNGMMLVFTGLLLRLENEAQLAAVLGHEVAHYARRHSLQQWRSLRAKTAALQTVSAVVSAGTRVAVMSAQSAAASGDYVKALNRYDVARGIANTGSAVLDSLELYAVLSQLAFSRDQESESDALGAAWMGEAGYDPAAFADIWSYMQIEHALARRSVPDMLRTHPSPRDRERMARAYSQRLLEGTPDADEESALRYQRVIGPFRNAWLHHARQGLTPELEMALIDRQREVGAPDGLISFHEADMYRKRNDVGDGERVLAALEKAVNGPGCPAEAHREYGLALWEAGMNDAARRAFEAYLEAEPDAVDLAMVRSYLEEL